MNFVGWFKRLQEDFDHVCDLIQGEIKRLGKINASVRCPYWEYYDEETKALVYQKYKEDIEYSGYKF
jgi:hypothetical protein